MPNTLGYSGSSGTMIGAALETIGTYYQSIALDNLTTLMGAASFFVYVVAAMFALGSFVLSGNKKGLLYLLMGPALYYMVISDRVSTKGSEWLFGGEARSNESVKVRSDVVTSQVGGANYEPRVSRVFDVYNRFISNTTRGVVMAINNGRQRNDLQLFVRAQLYGFTRSAELEEPGFRQLVHFGLLGQCRELMKEGQEAAELRNAPQERCEHAQKYLNLSLKTRVKADGLMANYLASLSVDCPAVFGVQTTTAVRAEFQKIEADINSRGGTCALNYGSATNSAGVDMQQVLRNKITCDNAAAATPFNQAALDDRSQLIKQRLDEITGKSYTCHEIWNFTYAGLNMASLKKKQRVIAEMKERGIPAEETMKEIAGFYSGTPGAPESIDITSGDNRITSAIALRLLKNEVGKGSNSSIIAEYENRGTSIGGIGLDGVAELSKREYEQTQNRKWQARNQLVLTAYNLPYYQGLTLYFLSMLFPFFAMTLLIPGKAKAMMTWFLLWLWAKSWDVGFAIVAMLDDILYSLFVSGFGVGPSSGTKELGPDLATAILSLREADPTFDVGTYYNLVALSLTSIPPVSAMLIHSSAQVLAGMAGMGLGRSVRGEGAAGGSKVADGGRNAFNSKFMVHNRSALNESIMQAAGDTITGDPVNALQGMGMDSQFRLSDSLGMGHNTMGRIATGASYASGFGSGLQQGLGNSLPGLAVPNGASGALSTAAKTIAGAAATIGTLSPWTSQASSAALNTASKRLKSLTAYAQADQLLTEGMARNMETSARGAYQISWNPGEMVYSASVEEYLARMQELATAALDTAPSSISGAVDGITKVIGAGKGVTPKVPDSLGDRVVHHVKEFGRDAAVAGTAVGVGAALGSSSSVKDGTNDVKDSAGEAISTGGGQLIQQPKPVSKKIDNK